MKRFVSLFLLMGIVTGTSFGQFLQLPQVSKKASVSEQVGVTMVTINYSRPAVNGRTGNIWGQLVPYGQPWRAGANENTIISFQHNVSINGKELPAGKYGFHIIPEENADWTLIFSKNHSSWGSFSYNQEEDVLRVSVTPETVAPIEYLKYEFTDQSNDGVRIELGWETKKIGFDVKTDLQNLTLEGIRNQLRHLLGFTWQAWNQAAQYCLNNDVNLEEGLQWAEMSISGNPFFSEKNFNNLQTKAQLLTKLGREAEAKGVIDEAIGLANMRQLHFYGRSLIQQGKAEDAMKMFELNRERHPDDNFTTYVGLARGYMALEKNKEAIKYFRKAASNAPQGQQQIYEGLAKQLEEKGS